MGLKSGAIGNIFEDTLKTWGTTWRNGKKTSATQKTKKPLPPNPTTQIKMLRP